MEVLLIHGMGRTPLSMRTLSRRLERAGHRARRFGYSPTFESLDGVARRLAARVHRLGGRPYALVGHSLGSVVIRHALPLLADLPPTACYFLAPPMVACRAARFFARFRLYRLLTGEMGQRLAQEAFMAALPLPESTTIYAGTAGPRAAWLPLGERPNDGILGLDEAGGASPITPVRVHALHTLIMNSRAVSDHLLASLARLERS